MGVASMGVASMEVASSGSLIYWRAVVPGGPRVPEVSRFFV